MSFIEDQLNRQVRTLTAQREKLIGNLEEIDRALAAYYARGDAANIDKASEIARKAVRDGRRAVVA